MMLSSIELPSTQTAIIQHDGGSLKVTSGLPVPDLKPHELLVRTASVALNPCDFKMPLRFPTPGLWDGCDFAGTIVAMGSKAAAEGRFHFGERVFGAVQGSNQADPTAGSYCEYVKIDQDFAFHLPKEVSFETAPAISGTGIATLGVALFWSLQIPGTLEALSKSPVDVLVYGGSSTIGLLAIQMVKLYVDSNPACRTIGQYTDDHHLAVVTVSSRHARQRISIWFGRTAPTWCLTTTPKNAPKISALRQRTRFVMPSIHLRRQRRCASARMPLAELGGGTVRLNNTRSTSVLERL